MCGIYLIALQERKKKKKEKALKTKKKREAQVKNKSKWMRARERERERERNCAALQSLEAVGAHHKSDGRAFYNRNSKKERERKSLS